MKRLVLTMLGVSLAAGCGERKESSVPDPSGEIPPSPSEEMPPGMPGDPPAPPAEPPPPDDPPDDLPPADEVTGGDPVSGTRIKARWHATDDGFRSLQGWFDSQLGVPCSWSDTSDGKRCVPTTALGSNTTFLDNQCTRPAVMFTPTACQMARPAYAGRSIFLPCGTQVATVSAVGDRVATSQVFSSASGGCAAITVAAGTEVYAVGSAVPLSAFVRATPSIETGSGRFANTYLIGEDGTRVVTGIRDTTLDTACMLTTAAGQVRCVPSLVSPVPGFSDTSCRTAIVEKDGGPCTTPASTVSVPDPATCSFRVLERGADFTGPMVFAQVGGTCSSVPTPEYPHQLVGAEVAVPVLAPAPVGSRLNAKLRSGGFATRNSTIRDTQLDFDCLPLLRGADGVRRCLPSLSQQAQLVYRNEACTEALHVAIVTPRTCPTPVPRFVSVAEPLACNDAGPVSKFRVFPVTTQITTPLYTKGTTCQRLVLGSSRAYALGPEEPASSFQRIELVTDP
jgi:hypothetical protein